MQRTKGSLFAIEEKYGNGNYQQKFISIFITLTGEFKQGLSTLAFLQSTLLICKKIVTYCID